MLEYKYEIYSKKNTKAADKPNEDFVYVNGKLGVGMVLDGVSRDRENGIYPSPSPAKEAVNLFSEAALRNNEIEKKSGIYRIQTMICDGNDELKKYNMNLNHRFPAGTVGVVFSIENGKFIYGYIGDCYAAIIRDDNMRVFTECQTEMIAKHKKEFTSDEIRFDICNHISHPCGYGVWNGDKNAMDFVKYGSIQVCRGDIIYIYTDGMKELLEKLELSDLAENIMTKLEELEYGKVLDDRTYIKIKFE